MERIPAPKPGKYPNTPFEVYASWDARNHSQLKLIEKSPLHFQQSQSEDSPAKIVGRAGHLALLEPDVFAARVKPAPVNPKTGNAYGYDTKAYFEASCAVPAGTLLLNEEDMEACAGMRRAVWNHPAARKILSEPALSELSCVWKEPNTGILCKMRGDRVSASHWVDFKTTESADPISFARSVVEYGYDTSEAFYDMGREALDIRAVPVLIVAEKRPPYAVAVYRIGQETMGTANQRVAEWMLTLERCMKANHFPGYDDDVVTLEAPAWHLAKFADGE